MRSKIVYNAFRSGDAEEEFEEKLDRAMNNPPKDHFFQEVQFSVHSEYYVALVIYGEIPGSYT